MFEFVRMTLAITSEQLKKVNKFDEIILLVGYIALFIGLPKKKKKSSL